MVDAVSLSSPRVKPHWTRRESRANPFEAPVGGARMSFLESLNLDPASPMRDRDG